MRLRHAAGAAGLILGLMSGTASAATLNFNYVGSSSFSFSLDSRATPTSFGVGYTEFDNLDATIDSMSTILSIAFYSSDGAGGAFEAFNGSNFDLSTQGDRIFSGPDASPKFNPGIFLLSEGGVPGTLTISSVPLPAAAPMFGAALLGLGLASYGVKRKKAIVAA